MAPLRVIVADDQSLFATGLASMLGSEPEIEVVGVARNGLEAVQMSEKFSPDVVLMDIRMPQMGGIDATRAIKAMLPATKVVLLTIYEQNNFIFEGLAAGASGYMLKDSDPRDLVKGIAKVMEGEYLISSRVIRQLVQAVSVLATGSKSAPFQQLSDRERDVLVLMSQGLCNKEIASKLAISEKTVRNHAASLYRKLHVYDRTQAALYALKAGLLESG